MSDRNINRHRSLPSIGGALRDRDYRLLWLGGGMDNTGRWMDAVAMSLLVLELTDSPWQVALLFVMRWLPMLVFAMVSGIIADRVNRWLVMMVARTGSVVTTAIILTLVASGAIQPWHLLLASLALGWLFVLEFPARRSLIYDIVGLRLISNAPCSTCASVLSVASGLTGRGSGKSDSSVSVTDSRPRRRADSRARCESCSRLLPRVPKL